MLVLERKNDEFISLFVEGREVKIYLISSQSGRAKIGIDATEDALILRGEILSAAPESFEVHTLV